MCWHRCGFLAPQTDLHVLVSCCLVQVSTYDCEQHESQAEDVADLSASNRMPMLRILVLDGVMRVNVELFGVESPHFAMASWHGCKLHRILLDLHLPHLAMLSWRNAGVNFLPFSFRGIKSAAVLDMSGSYGLQRLPHTLQARSHSRYIICMILATSKQ